MQGRRADIDLTGKQFYELFVKGEGPRINNKPTWNCLCSCGKECNCLTNDLISGKKKSCGHLRGKSRTLDLTGRTFFDLIVQYKLPNKGNGKSLNGNIVGKTFWRCLCSCGSECDVQTSDLTSGIRKDCGHSRQKFLHQIRTIDISGETHGYLKVLEMLPSAKNVKRWRAMCRCECLLCGNIIDIQRDYVINGHTQSCGCLKSKGEQEILQYLLENNIPHKTQYHFEDLKTERNGICWFDFGILNRENILKFLIEFQGKQHYEEQPGPWNFGKYEREVTDPLKRQYCKEHNIPLYEIRYDSNLKEELDKIFASQSCAKPDC